MLKTSFHFHLKACKQIHTAVMSTFLVYNTSIHGLWITYFKSKKDFHIPHAMGNADVFNNKGRNQHGLQSV